jgi:hypothetical protein
MPGVATWPALVIAVDLLEVILSRPSKSMVSGVVGSIGFSNTRMSPASTSSSASTVQAMGG